MLRTQQVEISKNVDVSKDYLINLYNEEENRSAKSQAIANVLFLKILYEAVEQEAGDDDVVKSSVIYNRMYSMYFSQYRHDYANFPSFIFENQNLVYQTVREQIR